MWKSTQKQHVNEIKMGTRVENLKIPSCTRSFVYAPWFEFCSLFFEIAFFCSFQRTSKKKDLTILCCFSWWSWWWCVIALHCWIPCNSRIPHSPLPQSMSEQTHETKNDYRFEIMMMRTRVLCARKTNLINWWNTIKAIIYIFSGY